MTLVSSSNDVALYMTFFLH